MSSVLMMLGVYFAYLEYNLFRIEISRQDDPLIQYTFVGEKGAFMVSGGSDIEIKEVAWSMPSVAASTPRRINKHPRILTLEDVTAQLYNDSSYLFTALSPHDREYFIQCGILANTYSFGIPLIAEVTFRQRGVEHLNTTRSLVYAEWLSSENPFIEVHEENASEEQKVKFVTGALNELREQFVLVANAFLSQNTHAIGKNSGVTFQKENKKCGADTKEIS